MTKIQQLSELPKFMEKLLLKLHSAVTLFWIFPLRESQEVAFVQLRSLLHLSSHVFMTSFILRTSSHQMTEVVLVAWHVLTSLPRKVNVGKLASQNSAINCLA